MMNRKDLLIAYSKHFSVHRRMFEAEWNRRNPTSVSFAQAMILNVLADEGPKQAKELIKLSSISSGGITTIADKLESLGLIRRIRDDGQDRRAVILEISEAGREMLVPLNTVRDETFQEIFCCLSDAEVAFLEHIYFKLITQGREDE